MGKCDINGCRNDAVWRCEDKECDLDVCLEHARPDGKCIYCSKVGIKWEPAKVNDIMIPIEIYKFVDNNPDCSFGELTKSFPVDVPPTVISWHIKKLVKRGMIKELPSPINHRTFRINEEFEEK